VRRNPIITNLLQRCNFVENMGTGITKIKDLCIANNTLVPEFTFDEPKLSEANFLLLFLNESKGMAD
jgi:predicted HTH transcriptional regulator